MSAAAARPCSAWPAWRGAWSAWYAGCRRARARSRGATAWPPQAAGRPGAPGRRRPRHGGDAAGGGGTAGGRARSSDRSRAAAPGAVVLLPRRAARSARRVRAARARRRPGRSPVLTPVVRGAAGGDRRRAAHARGGRSPARARRGGRVVLHARVRADLGRRPAGRQRAHTWPMVDRGRGRPAVSGPRWRRWRPVISASRSAHGSTFDVQGVAVDAEVTSLRTRGLAEPHHQLLRGPLAGRARRRADDVGGDGARAGRGRGGAAERGRRRVSQRDRGARCATCWSAWRRCSGRSRSRCALVAAVQLGAGLVVMAAALAATPLAATVRVGDPAHAGRHPRRGRARLRRRVRVPRRRRPGWAAACSPALLAWVVARWVLDAPWSFEPRRARRRASPPRSCWRSRSDFSRHSGCSGQKPLPVLRRE